PPILATMRSIMRPTYASLTALALALATTACDGCGDPEIVGPGDGGGGGVPSGPSATGTGGEDLDVTVTSSNASTGPGLCAGVACDPGFACVEDGDAGVCEPLTCDEADCSATEE